MIVYDSSGAMMVCDTSGAMIVCDSSGAMMVYLFQAHFLVGYARGTPISKVSSFFKNQCLWMKEWTTVFNIS
ncbi:hypothetical protein CEXT_233231 [Caerostris extrusa]|uniref:Uncharacterized protein n=1 Tax=Caerostris extrusa TaxID=172846 RepID=A0AAV4XUC5_CAEEX|nr:hypothetical protein CEXT_233231 [Caerostris extrusa]